MCVIYLKVEFFRIVGADDEIRFTFRCQVFCKYLLSGFSCHSISDHISHPEVKLRARLVDKIIKYYLTDNAQRRAVTSFCGEVSSL